MFPLSPQVVDKRLQAISVHIGIPLRHSSRNNLAGDYISIRVECKRRTRNETNFPGICKREIMKEIDMCVFRAIEEIEKIE